ncbi:hypothetical protein GGX14DRAFT_402056 [Mycena pura]|uniref:Uncharacterized protein n=1 Tax=Mycena pura TaxID=153505 RepID=A0AAD6Y5X1_9AGAR|nr:hypothetical protein GGX14DRAFT_402056 [Mycena pura]
MCVCVVPTAAEPSHAVAGSPGSRGSARSTLSTSPGTSSTGGGKDPGESWESKTRADPARARTLRDSYSSGCAPRARRVERKPCVFAKPQQYVWHWRYRHVTVNCDDPVLSDLLVPKSQQDNTPDKYSGVVPNCISPGGEDGKPCSVFTGSANATHVSEVVPQRAPACACRIARRRVRDDNNDNRNNELGCPRDLRLECHDVRGRHRMPVLSSRQVELRLPPSPLHQLFLRRKLLPLQLRLVLVELGSFRDDRASQAG